MKKYTMKELRKLVDQETAIDITHETDRNVIPNKYTQIGYAFGVYGCNGMLFQDDVTKELYAITTRSQAIYVFY